jgi:hypothetical protein
METHCTRLARPDTKSHPGLLLESGCSMQLEVEYVSKTRRIQ